MYYRMYFVVTICFFFFTHDSKGQTNIGLFQSLQETQFQLIYQDVINELGSLEESQRKELGIMKSVDINLESFVCELKFAKGDSILLFYPHHYPVPDVKKKVLKKYNVFLMEIQNKQRIPYELIKEFYVEVDVFANEIKLYRAFYILEYEENNLVITNKKTVFL